MAWTDTKEKAFDALEALLRDLEDRPGLRGAWDALTEDQRREIQDAWFDICRSAVIAGGKSE